MRTLVIDIEAAHVELPLEWDEADGDLDRDSLYDYWIHEVVSQPGYSWMVVDEKGNDVTKEYDYQ